MNALTSLLVSGLAVGAIYAIVALGFVLVFKATGVLNFAHGYFLTIASYLGLTFLARMGLSFVTGLLIIAAIMAATGVAVHYGIMRWMIGKAFFSIVLVTVGMEIIIRAGLLVAYGPLEFGRLQALPGGGLSSEFLGISISFVNLIVMGTAVAVVIGFLAFFRYTRVGLHMRAVAENLEAAAAMGINPNKIYAMAWAISLGMAAVGGVLYAHYSASIDLGLAAVGLRAFPAAIIGGIDSVQGAIIGGLIVGVVETLGTGYLGAEWRDVIAFGIMFLVLMWRPSGLFGTKELVRV